MLFHLLLCLYNGEEETKVWERLSDLSRTQSYRPVNGKALLVKIIDHAGYTSWLQGACLDQESYKVLFQRRAGFVGIKQIISE